MLLAPAYNSIINGFVIIGTNKVINIYHNNPQQRYQNHLHNCFGTITQIEEYDNSIIGNNNNNNKQQETISSSVKRTTTIENWVKIFLQNDGHKHLRIY